MSRSGSFLLKIGSIGFFLGFVSWALWAIMAILSFEGLLTYSSNDFVYQAMSGVYFQALYTGLIFYGFLSLSLVLCAVGCFGMSWKQRSGLGIASGVVFLLAFVSSVGYLVAFATVRIQQSIYNLRDFVLPLSSLFFLGLVLLGATLLTVAGKTGTSVRSRAAGILFVISGGLGILLLPAILYWGFEMWLFLLGWLYAAGAVLTVLIFFRMSRNYEKPAV